jgi:hypothetical protein
VAWVLLVWTPCDPCLAEVVERKGLPLGPSHTQNTHWTHWGGRYWLETWPACAAISVWMLWCCRAAEDAASAAPLSVIPRASRQLCMVACLLKQQEGYVTSTGRHFQDGAAAAVRW